MVTSADLTNQGAAAPNTSQFVMPAVPPPGFAGIKARVVIAFDVDGTLENSAGPIRIDRLVQLHSSYPHVVVAIVSPSAKRPPGFPDFSAGGNRELSLQQVKQVFPSDLYLYVSDNKDQAIAKKAGFTYIEAGDFV